MAFLHRNSTQKYVRYPDGRGYGPPKGILASFIGHFRDRKEPFILEISDLRRPPMTTKKGESYRNFDRAREEEEWRRMFFRDRRRKSRQNSGRRYGEYLSEQVSNSPLFTRQEVDRLLRAQEQDFEAALRFDSRRSDSTRYVPEHDGHYRGRNGIDRGPREYYHQDDLEEEDAWRDREFWDFISDDDPSWVRISPEARDCARYYQGGPYRRDGNMYDSC